VGPNLVSKLPKTYTDSFKHLRYLKTTVCETIFCEPVTQSELLKLIDSMDSKKACGSDNIGVQIIKDNVLFLVKPLVYIINLSLESGVVPDAMKIAKVVQIFKKGDKKIPSNYRPMSLISVLSKLLERFVHRRVYNFMDKKQLLYNFQFGFRKNHSTLLALLDVIDNCYRNIDLNNNVLGIYFDLQNVFDTVSHNILLDLLTHYAIRGVIYNWLKSYLSNRSQYTVVNGASSESHKITCGVPQGSYYSYYLSWGRYCF